MVAPTGWGGISGRVVGWGAVTTLDWIILLFVSVLAVYGYARGFVVGFLSLAGFAAGAFIATRLAQIGRAHV